MMIRMTVLILAALLLPALAHGQCTFDNQGTITNPNDPSCRDNFLLYTESNDSGNNIALGFAVPTPIDSQTPIPGFRSYASLFERHQGLLSDFPLALSGQVLGQTLNNRDIWVYSVSDPDGLTHDALPEPAMLVNGGIHAREWQSPETLTALMEHLTANSADGGLVQYLVENVNAVLIPVLNVDGFLQTQRFPTQVMASRLQPRDGRMRRKNLRHPSGAQPVDESLQTTGDNFFGVDLNRNQPVGFMNPARSSANPVSLVHHGPTPQSEPESQALAAAANLGPADRLRFYVDVHSFTQILFAPMTGNSRRDAITSELGARVRAVGANKYAWGPSNPGTEIGSTDGYFAYTYQIPAWTLETEPGPGAGTQYGGTSHGHAGFVLPATELTCMKDELVPSFLLGFYRMAGPAYVTAAVISAAADPADIYYRASWQPVNNSSRSLVVELNRPLLAGSDYRLWLAFSKPMRWRDGAGAIASFPGQRVAATPEVRIENPNDGSSQILDPAAGTWLASANTRLPTEAPDGYARYRDDAIAFDFTYSPGAPISGPTPLILSITAEDLSRQGIDADPATVADWENGAWARLENAAGTAGDSGGTDCQLMPFASDNPADLPPAPTGNCAAASSSPAPLPRMALTSLPPRTCVTPNNLPTTPPPPPPAPAPRSSGGGVATWLVLLIAAVAGWRRPRRRLVAG